MGQHPAPSRAVETEQARSSSSVGDTRIPVLMYHSVSDTPTAASRRLSVTPDQLEEQLTLLDEQGFTTVTMDHLVSGAPLPARPVVLTFDDGYADFHRAALPRLADHNATATLYVTTGWLADAADPAPESPPDRMLTWAEVAEAADAGVEIGGHSHTHAQLDQLGDAELRTELALSKDLLEDRLGRAVPGLAYPYGYWSIRVLEAARLAGYSYGAAVGNAITAPALGTFTLERLTVSRSTDIDTFGEIVAGRRIGSIYRTEHLLTSGWKVVRYARRLVGRTRHTTSPSRPEINV